MKELDSLKESAKQLKLINAKNKASLIIHALINEIKLALEVNISKKDIWRALAEESILGNNSYTSFLRILNPMLESQKTTIAEPKQPESKPVLAAKIPVADKPKPQPESTNPKTESEKKTQEPIWPKDETPSFVYNPIPRSDILD